jgi:hypothetical protein
MTPTAPRLLQAACEFAGGIGPLAQRLGIRQPMLAKYMSGAFPLPDAILLKAVDMLLEERSSASSAELPSGVAAAPADRHKEA